MVNAYLDLVFAYHYLAVFLPSLGIYRLVGISSFGVWIINLGHMLSIYIFQKYLEGELIPSTKAVFYGFPRPGEAKPFPPEKND